MTLSKTIQTLALASLLTFAPSEMLAAKKGGPFTTGEKQFLLNGKLGQKAYAHIILH